MPVLSKACACSSLLAIPLEGPPQAFAQVDLGAKAQQAFGLSRVDETDRDHRRLRAVVLNICIGIAVEFEQDLQDFVDAVAPAKADVDGFVAIEFLRGEDD